MRPQLLGQRHESCRHAKLDRKSQYLREVFRKSGRANPVSQVASAYIFEKKKRFPIDVFNHPGLRNVGMGVQANPSQAFPDQAVGYLRALGEDFVAKCLGGEGFSESVIVHDVNNVEAAPWRIL